jgi:hypothetical protein
MDGAMYSDILAFAALPCILRLVKKIRSLHNIDVVPFPFSPLGDVVPLPKLTSVPVISSVCLRQLPSLPPLSSLLSTRRAVTPSSQSVSYSNTSPLTVLSGSSCYLHSYESSPSSPSISVTTYLDTRNNVPSVGHSNPNVNAAISAQVYAINTNTRYLHPNINSLASKLIATLPPLDGNDSWVVTLTNSGSESNDLALRIANWYTSGGPVITYDMSYHGHTSALISVSPYKLKQVRIGWMGGMGRMGRMGGMGRMGREHEQGVTQS